MVTVQSPGGISIRVRVEPSSFQSPWSVPTYTHSNNVGGVPRLTLSLAGLRTGDAVAGTATGDGVTVAGGEGGAGLVHATSPAMTSATRLSERLVKLRDRRPTNKIPTARVDPEGTLELLVWRQGDCEGNAPCELSHRRWRIWQ